MILYIDMGNTRLKWRLCRDSDNVARGSILNQDGFTGLADALMGYVVEEIFVSSVLAEEANQTFSLWMQERFGTIPRFAASQSYAAGVTNGYQHPERLGVDRWLAILAGFAYAGGACVVVDCGSAITVDMVDECGLHLGGYIAPGIATARRALALNTHGVNVSVSELSVHDDPGRDTLSAVSAAQAVMIVHLVRHAVHWLSRREGASVAPKLLLTGGDADWLARMVDDAHVLPDLVFDGLVLAFSGR